jgi:uncharacterized membrane protein YjjP (DUF1212 family)
VCVCWCVGVGVWGVFVCVGGVCVCVCVCVGVCVCVFYLTTMYIAKAIQRRFNSEFLWPLFLSLCKVTLSLYRRREAHRNFR